MLKVVSVDKALEIIKEEFSGFEACSETVSLDNSLGRVLSEDIYSSESIPAFNRSTVDGFALRASDTFGCSESIPSQINIIGEVLMGERATAEVGSGQCVKISTGAMVPEGCDSVVMYEYTDTTFDDLCLIYKSVSPFENVTRAGDDIACDAMALKKGTVITSREVGILACLGVGQVSVAKKPKVAIISTGDEIIDIEAQSSFGKIRDINSHILFSLMAELGCDCKGYGIIRDSYDEISHCLERAVRENDIVLISGGSSAGARDMTADIIGRKGQVFLHGIAMKPGKPTIVGKIGETAVFGLPGHPAAAYFVALRLVKALIDMMLCRKNSDKTVRGALAQNISSNHGREEIVCVRVTSDAVEPVFAKSGIISLLSQSDGYIIIDRNCEGLKKNDEVQVILFR